MRLKLPPAAEAPACDRVLLDVTDAAFVLALGARPVRRASPNPEAPVAREGVKPGVKDRLPAGGVVMDDQRTRIVEQRLRRDAAEGAELALPRRRTP